MADTPLILKRADSLEDPALCEVLIERVDAPRPRFSLIDAMFVERGTQADWDLLKDLHYKGHTLGPGSRVWKCTLHGSTIGALVTANPKGLLKERHLVFPSIKPKGSDTKIENSSRYHFVNKNFRVVSRFVFDTMYRGVGAGYKMMNLVARMEGFRYSEIQSSMSKYNLFGQNAGFRFVRPLNANKFEAGLKFFRGHFASSPQDYEAIVHEIEAMPPAQRDAAIAACKEFYYKHSPLEKTGKNAERGVGRVAAMGVREVVKALQQITLASPMYGVYVNPDFGRADLPQRLPLTAYDRQGLNERLNLDALNG
jgi:ABC-type ATPase with predicted acetyltransferase domain